MIKYYCDICGKEIKDFNGFRTPYDNIVNVSLQSPHETGDKIWGFILCETHVTELIISIRNKQRNIKG